MRPPRLAASPTTAARRDSGAATAIRASASNGACARVGTKRTGPYWNQRAANRPSPVGGCHCPGAPRSRVNAPETSATWQDGQRRRREASRQPGTNAAASLNVWAGPTCEQLGQTRCSCSAVVAALSLIAGD
jgi:hypothetical protein